MNARTNTRSRSIGVVGSALAFAAYLVLMAVPAQAAVTCDYDAVNREVTLESTAAEPLQVTVGAGGAIFFDDNTDDPDGDPCGTATVNNTDGIVVLPDANVELDLSGGPFAPGETPEASGTSEIEIEVDGNVNGGINLHVVGSSGADTITVGNGLAGPSGGLLEDGAVNWNGDGDADVTFQGMGDNNDFDIFGQGGDDVLSLNGGAGTGAFLEQDNTDVEGGDGNDTLTGTSFDSDNTTTNTSNGDDLNGDEGNDVLNGLGGDDFLDDNGLLTGGATCAQDELDVLNGGDDEDDLDGGTGDDLMNGGLASDVEEGLDCNDTFDQGNGPNGDDTLVGGDPISADGCFGTRADLVDYGDRNSDLLVDLTGGQDSGEVGAAEADDLQTIESALAGSGDDEIIGSGLENFLAGGAGNDTFNAFSSHDCIQPGAGDDTVDGAANDDMVDYSDAPNGVVVDLDAGTATGHGTDTLIDVSDINGSTFNDTLLGDENPNEIFGNAGDDTIDTRGDVDFGDGGEGNDSVVDTGTEMAEGDHLLGGNGNDTIDGGVGGDDLDGDDDANDLEGQGNDTIEGGEGDDHLDGEGGDDVLTDSGVCDAPFEEDDTLHGGDGSDVMSSGDGRDVFDGDSGFNGTTGDGDDTINSGAGDDEGVGDGGNDTISDTGTDDGTNTGMGDGCEPGDSDSDDRFNGADGDDTITLGEGNDGVYGDAGDDQLFGEAGDDDLNGHEDDDLAEGGDGDDGIFGGDDTDTLRGDAGEDTIEGQDGADKVEGGPDDDELDGDGDGPTPGSGFSAPDTVVYAHLVDANGDGNGQDVDLQLGFSEGDDGNDIVINFEKAKGSKFDDTIKGGGGAAATNFFLAGGKGDDVLTGSGSNDTLKGAGGNDLLIGLQGGDTLKGGKGNDEGQGGPGADVCFKVEHRVSCQAA